MQIHDVVLVAMVDYDRTTLGLYTETRARFMDAKPYDSMSSDEFIRVLLNHWEDEAGEINHAEGE